jgi:hypothetical protein
MHHFLSEIKLGSKEWCHSSLLKPEVAPSAGKVILIVFWDMNGIVVTDFLQKGLRLNSKTY